MNGTVSGPLSAAIYQAKIAIARLGAPSPGRPRSIGYKGCLDEYQKLVKLTLRLEHLEKRIRRAENLNSKLKVKK